MSRDSFLRLPLPPSAEDPWRLLTPTNISIRRAWPWSLSIQKHIDSGEPRPRSSANLVIASDYGGEHPRATHRIYCFLVVRSRGQGWLSSIDALRGSFLPDRRAMCYKRLDDRHRQDALIPFLQAAADLDGHLVAIAVDKRKKWLSTTPSTLEVFRKDYGLTAKWNRHAFEAMMRKIHFISIILSIWSRPYTNVTWITDQDEFVANDARHDDALLTAGRVSSFYVPHPMGVFRLNTTGQDPEQTEYEDLCAIPDLAAGMLSEVAARLLRDAPWEDGLRQQLKSSLPMKAGIIANWFWDHEMTLRKTLISVDVDGSKCAVRKVWMTEEGAPA